jgi:hypothetical protein
MNDVRGILYAVTKFSTATYAEIPADDNLNHLSTSAYRNLSSLARRLALKCLEISPPHRFVAHSVSGLDTPRNQSHHLRFYRLLAIMTRGNQRDKAREKNLKEQAAAVRAPEQFTYPLHAVRGWPGRTQEANPTL